MNNLGWILDDRPGDVGQTLVARVGDGGGYEWFVFLLFRDNATGVLRWWWGAGCSCSSPMEDVTSLDDLVTGTARDALTDLKSFVKENEYWHGVPSSYINATDSNWFKELTAEAEKQAR